MMPFFFAVNLPDPGGRFPGSVLLGRGAAKEGVWGPSLRKGAVVFG